MKILIIVLIASMYVACSSAKKQPDAPKTPTPAAAVAPTQSAPKMDSSVKKEICESDGDQRILEVSKKENGCELSYAKFGKSKVVSTGKYGTKHCEASFDKIIKKLEADKFNCHAE